MISAIHVQKNSKYQNNHIKVVTRKLLASFLWIMVSCSQIWGETCSSNILQMLANADQLVKWLYNSFVVFLLQHESEKHTFFFSGPHAWNLLPFS